MALSRSSILQHSLIGFSVVYRGFRPHKAAPPAVTPSVEPGSSESSSVEPKPLTHTAAPTATPAFARTNSATDDALQSITTTMPVQQHVLNWLYSVLTSVCTPPILSCTLALSKEAPLAMTPLITRSTPHLTSFLAGISRCQPHVRRRCHGPRALSDTCSANRCLQYDALLRSSSYALH